MIAFISLCLSVSVGFQVSADNVLLRIITKRLMTNVSVQRTMSVLCFYRAASTVVEQWEIGTWKFVKINFEIHHPSNVSVKK